MTPQKKNLLLYSVLFFAITAWPFLNFYASETNQKLIWATQLVYFFLIIFGFSFVVAETIIRLFKIPRDRMLILYTAFVLFFYSSIFKHFINLSSSISISYKSIQYIFISLICMFIIYKFSKSHAFRKAVAMFIGVLFFFSLIETTYIALNLDKVNSIVSAKYSETFSFKNKPNIYFLLLDAYTRADLLKEKTGFSNKAFLSFLKSRGFIISDKSYSNYTNTSESLSATFSMNYNTYIPYNPNDILSPHKEVFKVLKANDYKIIMLPGYYSFIDGRNVADIKISYGKLMDIVINNIYFWRENILSMLKSLFRPYFYFGIDKVKKIFELNVKEPKFVYLHFLGLHDLAYEKNCKIESRLKHVVSPFSYDHHLSCMNSLIEKSIDEILRNDPKSIIIVQGDHGPLEWQAASNQSFKETFSIMAAYRIPDLESGSTSAEYLSDSPTPVNNFRIIFSHLAETPVNLLPSRQFKLGGEEVTHLRPLDKILTESSPINKED